MRVTQIKLKKYAWLLHGFVQKWVVSTVGLMILAILGRK